MMTSAVERAQEAAVERLAIDTNAVRQLVAEVLEAALFSGELLSRDQIVKVPAMRSKRTSKDTDEHLVRVPYGTRPEFYRLLDKPFPPGDPHVYALINSDSGNTIGHFTDRDEAMKALGSVAERSGDAVLLSFDRDGRELTPLRIRKWPGGIRLPPQSMTLP